jgi:hypothetical protein
LKWLFEVGEEKQEKLMEDGFAFSRQYPPTF